VLTYAAWRRGLCVVPVPPELSVQERGEVFRRIALAALVTAGDATDLDPATEPGDPVELRPHLHAFSVRPLRDRPPGLTAIEPAFIRFSSNTTGLAKGVVLEHATVADRIGAANASLGIGPGDRIGWTLSMSHHFAVSIVNFLTHGATIVLIGDRLGQGMLRALRRHAVTLTYAAPAHYQFLSTEPSGETVPALRLALCTTARMPSGLGERFRHRFGLPRLRPTASSRSAYRA
jgi:long-chain acyl-CoA synthetase